MQRVPDSAWAGPPPPGTHPEPCLPSNAHRKTTVTLHTQPYGLTRSHGINATSSQIEKKTSRSAVFMVIKNYLKNITSSFPVFRSVKDDLQNEQTPAVLNTTLSTYAAPRDWCCAAVPELKCC